MRIFLDENMPRKLMGALRSIGHEAESVHTLHIEGIANGALYEHVAQDYDLFFTRDVDFVEQIRKPSVRARVKIIRVRLKQQPQEVYISEFLRHFK